MRKYDSTSDMDSIQKGLEEFAQQEIIELRNAGEGKRRPQIFDLTEETEDWDSPEHIARVKRQKDKSRTANSGKKIQQTASRSAKPEKKTKQPVKTGKEENQTRKGEEIPQKRKKNKKKKSKFKRFCIILLLFLAITAAGLYYVVDKVYGKMNYEPVESVASEPVKGDGVVNILLIGTDSRTGDTGGRSDAMILLSINSRTRQMYMSSLLRDMYVEIPGHDNNRLNAAYAYGGPELLMETIELNFDITVNRYVVVNFEAFANLVDAVGGIELELTNKEVEYVNAFLWEYNVLTGRPEGTDYMDTSLSGVLHLNGPQALAYTRNRSLGTDFGRTERQRKVLSAIMKKAPMAMVTNGKDLINGLLPNLTTNVTQAECYRLGFLAAGALTYETLQGSIPVEGSYRDANIRGMAVLEVDFEANKQYLKENIYGKNADK